MEISREEFSPLHIDQLLTKGRRPNYSTGGESTRVDEVQDIPYSSSTRDCSSTGLCQASPTITAQAGGETIIEFMYNNNTSWESDEHSDTSTPDFKRGVHRADTMTSSVNEQELTQQPVKELQEDSKKVMEQVAARRKDNDRVLTHLAVMELRRSRPNLVIPPWIALRRWRGHSILILADSQLDHWPSRDRICSVITWNWLVS